MEEHFAPLNRRHNSYLSNKHAYQADSPAIVDDAGSPSWRSQHHISGGTRDQADGHGPNANVPSRRILLIEPDEANALLIRSVLADDDGYEVRWVSTPLEAFETLQLAPDADGYATWPADLILFDLTWMDNETRRHLSHIIKSHHRWPPVIMLSNWPLTYMEHILDGMGRSDVIAKPFDLEVLSDSVRQVLQKRDR